MTEVVTLSGEPLSSGCEQAALNEAFRLDRAVFAESVTGPGACAS